MSNCKCSSKKRISSQVIQNMNGNTGCYDCYDVCANPIIADPNLLGIMAPLIYDEIGINLCATFPIGGDISTNYPTATNAGIQVVSMNYENDDTGVNVEAISGRPNCYLVTLSNITLTFAVTLYDANCKIIGILFPTAQYLPSNTTLPTSDPDTNPTSVDLEIFAPYGLPYDTTGTTPATIVNAVSFGSNTNGLKQGLNLFAQAKVIDLNKTTDNITVGVTFVLQSLYYAGYKVRSAGKIDIPKGSIITPDNADCLRFVAGDLLNLAIKPLDLGEPEYQEKYKNDCQDDACTTNGGNASDS